MKRSVFCNSLTACLYSRVFSQLWALGCTSSALRTLYEPSPPPPAPSDRHNRSAHSGWSRRTDMTWTCSKPVMFCLSSGCGCHGYCTTLKSWVLHLWRQWNTFTHRGSSSFERFGQYFFTKLLKGQNFNKNYWLVFPTSHRYTGAHRKTEQIHFIHNRSKI